MTVKRYQRTRVQEIDAFQHAKDDYWFRPVVIGKNLYTYVAYVPPGGFMPPHGHEEDPYELSFFMLRGTLEVMLDGDTFTAHSGDAVHIEPTVSLGVRNTSGEMASFVLTFNPPPPITSVEGLRQRFIQRGYGLRTAAEMETLLQRGPGQS
jgi:quercetin dioxygenase-like cupin family protein